MKPLSVHRIDPQLSETVVLALRAFVIWAKGFERALICVFILNSFTEAESSRILLKIGSFCINNNTLVKFAIWPILRYPEGFPFVVCFIYFVFSHKDNFTLY